MVRLWFPGLTGPYFAVLLGLEQMQSVGIIVLVVSGVVVGATVVLPDTAVPCPL